MSETAQTYLPHDCYAWNTKHYHNSPRYHAVTCGYCGKIIGFRWRSWRDRIKGLFVEEVRP